jgi:hypothetical protein
VVVEDVVGGYESGEQPLETCCNVDHC